MKLPNPTTILSSQELTGADLQFWALFAHNLPQSTESKAAQRIFNDQKVACQAQRQKSTACGARLSVKVLAVCFPTFFLFFRLRSTLQTKTPETPGLMAQSFGVFHSGKKNINQRVVGGYAPNPSGLGESRYQHCRDTQIVELAVGRIGFSKVFR